MKFTIQRQFAIGKKLFEIYDDGKLISMAKVKSSKEHRNQYDLSFYHVHIGYRQTGICQVVIDENRRRSYLIFFENQRTNEKILFGRIEYQTSPSNENLYTIYLASKIYQVTSSDLRNRRLTIVDATPIVDGQSNRFHMKNLLQVNDLFSRSNKTLHLTIDDAEQAFGYLSIVILLQVHESKRMSIFG